MINPADAEDEDKKPSTELDDDALFVRLQGLFPDDWRKHLEWMDGNPDKDGNGGAKEDFDFRDGRQWNEDALQTLQQQGRPASVFNRVAPMLDAVCGYEVSNRQETRFIPREPGDVGVNEVLTSANNWFRDLSDAEDEDSDAFRDAATAGHGWTETRVEYETNPDGDPIISRVPPFEICADRDACKPNFSDAKRIWRVRRMTLADARALIPEAEDNELHAGWAATQDTGVSVKNPVNDYQGAGDSVKAPSECVLIECQWWERVSFIRYVDPAAQQIVEMEPAKFKVMLDRMLAMPPMMMLQMGLMPPVNPVTQYRRVYHRAFIGTKLFRKPMPVEGAFNYQAVTGKRDENTGQFYGLVRAMKDPQRWTNKLFSQIMHILNSNAKGGILAERGAFEDDRKAAADWPKADSITFTNAGAIANQRIMNKPVAAFPQGQAQMLQFAMESMPLVTGINQELLGLRETNQPGVLEYQRKQSGLTILATLFDNQRRYRKGQGRLMLKVIQQYLSDGRLVKIVGRDGAKYIPLVRQQTAGEYDVIVDDAPTAPNSKEKNWAIVQSMLPMLMPLLQQDPKLTAQVIQTSPLPDSLVQSMVEMLTTPPPPKPGPTPEEQMQQRILLAGAVAEVDKTASTAEKNRADADQTKAETMRDNIKAMLEGLAALPVQQELPPAMVPNVPLAGVPFGPGSLTLDPGILGPQPQQMPMLLPAPPMGGMPGF